MSLQVKAAKAGLRSGYRGDPGLFGSIGKFIGGVGKAAVGAVGGMLTGGPLGAVGGALKGAGIIKTPAIQTPATNYAQYTGGMMNSGVSMPGVGRSLGPLNGYQYPATTTTGVPATQTRAFPARREEGPPGPGYHLNKGGYYRRTPAGSVVYVPAETVWVRNRRRNPLNPRALDRALGRVTSAKAASKKLSRVTVRKSCGCK